MKMSPKDFADLKAALLVARRQAGFLPGNLLNTRQMWDVFHRAWGQNTINGNELYKHYNDVHIETAMKVIFK